MSLGSYETLEITIEKNVATVTINHPPLNLMDVALLRDLDQLARALEADREVRVVVFQSADPEFFIAHADVTLIQQLPSPPLAKSSSLGWVHQIFERFRLLPKVTIGKLEGRARGGGSEFLLSLDLRFGAIGKAIVSQPEVALGIIPGGSGTQRLAGLMGRARALEAVLGCRDFPAELAERYGWINRALPAEELGPFVDALARRIASFPPEAVALAKRAVDAAELGTHEGLLEEAHLFNLSLGTREAKERMQAFMTAGGQTRDVELKLDPLLEQLLSTP